MFHRLNRVLLGLSRWPRRLAALACLLLAAAAALTPAQGSSAAHRGTSHSDPITATLGRDEVAVPITATAASAAVVRVGVRIGIYGSGGQRAGPVLLADRLRVLAITAGDDLAGAAPVLVVAADRSEAGRLIGIGRDEVLVVIDN